MRESMFSHRPVFGVKKPSPLINLKKFKVVPGFVPDYLHFIDLGTAEQFIGYGTSKNNEYSLTQEEIFDIDHMLKTIKIPIKVSRLSSSILKRRGWKGREWQNWILFYSLPALMNISRLRRFAEHWSLLLCRSILHNGSTRNYHFKRNTEV